MCFLAEVSKAADNKMIERIYNLSCKEFNEQLNYYIQYNKTDSAMLCANIWASKYNKEKLSEDEIVACCAAFRYMGVIYLQDYYNYQLATENYQKAEQIAQTHNLRQLQEVISTEKAILSATRNDLEQNFTFSPQVLECFSNAFFYNLKNLQTNPSATCDDISYLEISLSNLLLLAIKYDKTYGIAKELSAYRDALARYGTKGIIVDVMCRTVDY